MRAIFVLAFASLVINKRTSHSREVGQKWLRSSGFDEFQWKSRMQSIIKRNLYPLMTANSGFQSALASTTISVMPLCASGFHVSLSSVHSFKLSTDPLARKLPTRIYSAILIKEIKEMTRSDKIRTNMVTWCEKMTRQAKQRTRVVAYMKHPQSDIRLTSIINFTK